MRSLILCIIGLCMAQLSIAQNGLLIRAEVGAGRSTMTDLSQRMSGPPLICDCGYSMSQQTSIVTPEGSVEVGYEYKLVRVMTGIQLLRTAICSMYPQSHSHPEYVCLIHLPMLMRTTIMYYSR